MYVRVSTDGQVEGYSIDAQIELLKSYLKSKEIQDEDIKLYIDAGFSGKDLKRPKMDELIEDITNDLVKCVYVYKLDRISRSQKDTLYLIEEVFNKHEVGFVSIRESFDTTTPFGKAMIGILSVFAQLERETILERTRLGIYKRAEEGLWRGGGKVPFPYDYDKEKGILVPNHEDVKVFNKMVSLYLGGMSFIKIGEIVNMDESLVQRRILSKTNTGIVPYKDEEFEGQHEPVISKETYERILEVSKLRSRGRTQRRYLLSGKLYCGNCSAKYRYQKWGKRIICYCYSQQKSKPKFVKDHNCKNKRYESFQIEDVVLENLFSMSLDEKLFKDNYELAEVNVLEEYKNRVSNIDTQVENLLNFISSGIAVKETSEKIKKLQLEKGYLEKELKKIKGAEKRNKQSFNLLRDLKSTWDFMTFDERRTIIEHIIDRVVLYNNEIKIYYKIP
ncbi:MAG: recombinase family protein [Bacilli bacterium]|nr:recombinase family protein [Bacilli bacterium]